MAVVISFVGRHNAGKTTILRRLVALLRQQGLKIAFIKHSHHELEIGSAKDAELVLQAGADFVVASSPHLQVQYHQYTREPELAAILAGVPDNMDLVIVEGFKTEPLPKIEVVRQAIDPVPMLLPHTLALISDFPLQTDLPRIPADDIEALAHFVCHWGGLKTAPPV